MKKMMMVTFALAMMVVFAACNNTAAETYQGHNHDTTQPANSAEQQEPAVASAQAPVPAQTPVPASAPEPTPVPTPRPVIGTIETDKLQVISYRHNRTNNELVFVLSSGTEVSAEFLEEDEWAQIFFVDFADPTIITIPQGAIFNTDPSFSEVLADTGDRTMLVPSGGGGYTLKCLSSSTVSLVRATIYVQGLREN